MRPRLTRLASGRLRAPRCLRIMRSLVGAVVLFAVLAVMRAPVAADTPRVYAVNVRGVISPLAADYVVRVLDKAESEGAAAAVIQIGSPGGIESATRRIAQSILVAKIPVIVYVGPGTGTEALSGAMFIVLAGNVAAMAPGSSIGAGLPSGLADRADQQERDARTVRALQIATATAQARGRNLAAVIAAVQDERVRGAPEALQDGIIDRVSRDIPTLLDQVDGTRVRTAAGNVTLNTRSARLSWIQMTWRERLLQEIADPNVAYVLFSAGVLLLIVALYAGGRLLAGIPGVVALVTAFVAFGNLPFSWLGLGLLILGAVLFIAELYSSRVGITAALGVASYLAGSFALYRPVRQESPFAPDVSVSPWIAVGTVAFFVVTLLLILRTIFRAEQRLASRLIGLAGIATTPIAPQGRVRVRGQDWPAETSGAGVEEGAQVVVRAVSGHILRVEPFGIDALPADPSSQSGTPS